MGKQTVKAQVLVGPRTLGNRIYRLVYRRDTDEAWTEQWSDQAWVRAPMLVRYVLSAPTSREETLARRGIPGERGEWDREPICA